MAQSRYAEILMWRNQSSFYPTFTKKAPAFQRGLVLGSCNRRLRGDWSFFLFRLAIAIDEQWLRVSVDNLAIHDNFFDVLHSG